MTNPHQRLLNNGDMNKLLPEDWPAHNWYRFVLSFPPHLVRDYLERFSVTEDQRVLDPFCGTGTTLVECKKHGIPSVGIEANPIAHFASEVKVDWSLDPNQLNEHASTIAELVQAELRTQGIDDQVASLGPLFQLNTKPHQQLRALPTESAELLLTNSISPIPLHKSLVLKDWIQHFGEARCRRHQLLALAKALVFSISNLQFGPEVGVGPIKEDTPVVAPWLAGVREMAEDIRNLQVGPNASSTPYLGDSRNLPEKIKPNSIDIVITSPPYPNEKDYTRTTRLESVMLDFIKNRAELRSLKRGLMRSNTRNVYRGDSDDSWVAHNSDIQKLAQTIEERRIELGKTSGFEKLYPVVTKLYFGGIARHLAELRTVLRPDAQLAYIVGDQASYLRVMIRTGQLLADIAQSLGYDLVGIDLFRTRLATATKEQLREEVVVLRWSGKNREKIYMSGVGR